jgi:hypothetical protein
MANSRYIYKTDQSEYTLIGTTEDKKVISMSPHHHPRHIARRVWKEVLGTRTIVAQRSGKDIIKSYVVVGLRRVDSNRSTVTI